MSDQQRFGMDLFWNQASVVVERVLQSQKDVIARAAEIFASSITQGGVIHAYGTGHSRAFAMELAGRAGGLVPVNRMDLEDLALKAGWPHEVVVHPDIERDPEAGKQLLSCYRIEPHDAFIFCSNSGVNVAMVEVARQVKEKGYPLVVVTSMQHTQRVSSRHPSGKKLYEFADVVIDNHGPFGDALLELPGGGTACAVSSITGVLIAQMITAETIGLLLERGEEVPVYISANVPGGIERNLEIVRRYEGRIRPV